MELWLTICTQFNECRSLIFSVVNVLLASLRRGDEASNLIMELFKGYKVVSDHEFVKYIKTREDRYLEGEALTDDLLMQLALNKYIIMKENGEWGALTEQEEQMTALSAELSKKMEALSEINKQINRRGKID